MREDFTKIQARAEQILGVVWINYFSSDNAEKCDSELQKEVVS